MTPLQPSADNLAAVNSDAPEVAADLDDRLRAAYVKAHDAEEAWLESTGHLYDPSLPIDAGIRAVLREAQAHPSRGVVDEDVVMQAERAFWPAYNEALRVHGTKADCHAIGMRAALQAAALPAVPEGFDIGRANTLIQYVMGYCRSAEMRTLSSDAIQALKQLELMLAATPAHDQPEGGRVTWATTPARSK